jgi:hypothetical protein
MTLPRAVRPAENESLDRHEWSDVYGSSNEAYRKLQTLRCPLIGTAKESDTANPSLPSPEERKQIEPPKRQLPAPDGNTDLDRNTDLNNDIPF